MSAFQDEQDLNEHFSDNPEFDTWCDQIMTNLFEMNGHLSTLQQFIKTLQKCSRQGNVRSKMVENLDTKSVAHIESVSKLLKVVNDLVHKISAIEEPTLNSAQLISREKLVRDVKFSVQGFQTAQKSYTQVSKAINDQAKASLSEERNLGIAADSNTVALEGELGLATTTQDLRGHQQRQEAVIERESINNEEFAYQQNLIRERDREISQIESGIVELNGIFQDLSNIVQEQGHMVDNIESNIYSVANSTQTAAKELSKALSSQRHANKWCIYMLLVVSFMLLIMVLIVAT
ncbi:LAMI_0E13080g1_1 [Lachancea mirantina]|uniref:LAMI_0E13080g1_1 n=1 Tax=Lachancea mirantina TaxID=1230905 RepID=A0A1G4JQL8_9SACH|nr:LAMI_0E13080g1_1 [Lachancea mirantina]